VPFEVAGGLVDIGTHMALVRLSTGKFVALGTIDPASKGMRYKDAPNSSVKNDIDLLTNRGSELQAVVATHPFHTSFFQAFYNFYPQSDYYGTPRHLRIPSLIRWESAVDKDVLGMFEPDLYMRIPPWECTEFNNPVPWESNHFANVFVFHPASKVLFNDDCICYFCHTKGLQRMKTKLGGLEDDAMRFHMSMHSVGLRKTPEAPGQFIAWIEQMLFDWDFGILCSAHNGICRADAKQRLTDLLERDRAGLMELAAANNDVMPDSPQSRRKADDAMWGDPADVECV